MSAKQTNTQTPPLKMCKSPGVKKSAPKTDYEGLSTNCTLVGSNNLNLDVYATPKINICSKPMKQQQLNFEARTILASKNQFSPIGSPQYPQNAVSPYNVQISSPGGMKSPGASPQQLRPPTPQPILPQAFQQIPVMTSGANLVQIFHNNPPGAYQNHGVLARQTIIGPPNQNLQQPSPLIKIKPPQNILPKPPATSGAPPQPPKPPGGGRPLPQTTTVVQNPQLPPNPPQLVLPNQTILPAAQPGTLLLNQMPLIVQQNATHGGVQLILRPSTPNSSPQLTTKSLAPQNLILQQGGAGAAPQVILQHAGGQRGAMQQPQQLVRVLTANGMLQHLTPTYITMNNQLNLQQITQPTPINQPPSQPNKILTQNGQHILQNHQGLIGACLQAPVNAGGGGGMVGTSPGVGGTMDQLPPPKRKPKKKKKIKEKLDLGSIMKLSGIGDEDDVMFESDNSESTNTDSNPVITQNQPAQQPQKLITSHSRSPPITSPLITSPLVSTPLISSPLVTSPLNTSENDPKRIHINQNLTQSLSQNLSQNLGQPVNQVLPEKQPFAQSQLSVQQSLSDINAINQNLTQIGLIQNSAQNFINSSNQFNSIINQDNQNLANFLSTLQNQNFGLPGISGLPKFPPNPQNFQNLSDSLKTNGTANFPAKNLLPTHFNIPNIQVQNFPNQNLILNQAPNTILAPNFQGNLTLNNGILQNNLIQNAGNLNFLQTGSVSANSDQYAGLNLQRTGGFKLALSEDGRLILQHDPNLNQDLQSQLLLQNIFGINLQGGNLVLTSVSQPQAKVTPNEPILTQKEPILAQTPKKPPDQTKTTNILQNVITSAKSQEPPNLYEGQKFVQPPTSLINTHPPPQPQIPPQTQINPTGNPQAPYVVNLTPNELDLLKKNGQVAVNGQIIYMQRPSPKIDPQPPKSPKSKPKTKKFPPKPNQTLINQLQSPTISQKNDPKPLPKDPPQILAQKPPHLDEKPSEVEQFLSNLNINTSNLSQLISQKLSQELPNVDHKILNIKAGPNAGQLVAKIDISSADMTQIESNLSLSENLSQQIKQETDTFAAPNLADTQTQQMPALVLSDTQSDKNTVYQRIQTIQLTPQKQQLLKSVQLQIQALTARLQQKDSKPDKIESNIPENDIQNALRHLYLEQQKILATGKLLPTINQPITSLNCPMETMSSQSGPVVATPPKSNGSYVTTSLLQQPVVSSNQGQKIYYHNGNQIITVNPSNILASPVMSPTVTSSAPNVAPSQPPQLAMSTSIATQTQTVQTQAKLKKAPAAPPLPANVATPAPPTSDKGCQMSPNQTSSQNQVSVKTETQEVATVAVATAAPTLSSLLSPKCRPTKPTYSKAQLIEQQLQTDQNGANSPDINTPFASKADACKRLVRYHCYNQPVLSEKDLNKADEIFELTARHFIGKFQGMVNKYKYLLLKESMREVPTSELMMIDRMFLAEEQQSFLKLQSDLKLQHDLEVEEDEEEEEEARPLVQEEDDIKREFDLPEDLIEEEFVSVKQEGEADARNRTDFNIKCGLNYFADESCDSVYEEGAKEEATQKVEKAGGGGNGESYNTTKIIGNFEIEINNKGCSSQESYTKNFRQKIIENKTSEGRTTNVEDGFEKGDDYDEWLCIQRELGYLSSSEGGKSEGKEGQEPKEEQKNATKRNSNENRLETLKKFRVEKHNSHKSKKSGGSIIGEVKFEVRIEHKKVQGAASKRAHYEFQNQGREEGVKRAKSEPAHQMQIKQEEHYLEDDFLPDLLEGASPPDGLIDTSIDEQVQSAIDSILNLQQIASMTEQQKEQQQQQQQVTCRNINTLTGKGDEGSPDFNSETLDDAVKSILS